MTEHKTEVITVETTSYKMWTEQESEEMNSLRQAKWKNYGPTTLQIKTDVTDHHEKHPVNMLLRDYNEFVRLVF